MPLRNHYIRQTIRLSSEQIIIHFAHTRKFCYKRRQKNSPLYFAYEDNGLRLNPLLKNDALKKSFEIYPPANVFTT